MVTQTLLNATRKFITKKTYRNRKLPIKNRILFKNVNHAGKTRGSPNRNIKNKFYFLPPLL